MTRCHLPDHPVIPLLPAPCSPLGPTSCRHMQEHNDTLLTILLAALTKGTSACNEIVDKVGGRWIAVASGLACCAGRRIVKHFTESLRRMPLWQAGMQQAMANASPWQDLITSPPPPPPAPPQCNLAFDRVSLKGSGRKGGGGMGSTIGLGLPMSMMGGGPPGFL